MVQPAGEAGCDALRPDFDRRAKLEFYGSTVTSNTGLLTYNLANFMRTLALPEAVASWSLTSLREKLVKVYAKVVRHARYAIF